MKRVKKIFKVFVIALTLSLTIQCAVPAIAATQNQSQTSVTKTASKTTTKKPPKNGVYKKNNKTYYYKNGKLVKNKYGYKIKNKYYRIDKNGVLKRVSTVEGLAGIRLEKCGGNLKKAFQWSSTKLRYWGNVGKPKKGQNAVEYYALYGFQNNRGDCYVMAATFCMMAKVYGYKDVRLVKGTVPQQNGKNGAHGWCEIKINNKTYVYDPNFAYTYRNSNVKHHSGYKFTYSMLGKGYGLYRYNLKNLTKIKA